jgi:hypothetical protein
LLLRRGTIRVKSPYGVGGRDQFVARDVAELDAALERIDDDALAACGVVLEENLERLRTYSVGQVRVAGLTVSYFGTQMLTPDHAGAEVYGGSDLTFVRGGFEALQALRLARDGESAVTCARRYDRAADAAYRGFFASRRNYDVAQGVDGRGCTRCGVLEQSWRIGGASSAEIAALEAFAAEPHLHVVRATCYEVYGEAQPPREATVYFRGVDAKVGRITKYTVVQHVDCR